MFLIFDFIIQEKMLTFVPLFTLNIPIIYYGRDED